MKNTFNLPETPLNPCGHRLFPLRVRMQPKGELRLQPARSTRATPKSSEPIKLTESRSMTASGIAYAPAGFAESTTIHHGYPVDRPPIFEQILSLALGRARGL